jgi:transposase-like protein
MVKVREDRSVRTRACYLAIGVTVDRDREVLGIWWQVGSIAGRWVVTATTGSARPLLCTEAVA